MANLIGLQSTGLADFLPFASVTASSGAGGTVGFMYIPQTSVFTLTSSSGTSSGPTPSPGVATVGLAAIMYCTVSSKLCIFSTVANEWRSLSVTCS